MNRLILAFAAAASVAAALPVAGQAQVVSQTQVNQQHRIGQGVATGQLTPGETNRLEHREAVTSHVETRMLRRSHGHLTYAQRHRLHRRERHLSQSIAADKHNGRTY